MVSTIIAIARNFKMGVIAEGVESDGQLERLVELGCQKVQGYLFSPAAAGIHAPWLDHAQWFPTVNIPLAAFDEYANPVMFDTVRPGIRLPNVTMQT